ncbi:MAG TPA: hypothetical protein ENH20_00870 [Candidatus Pacearchaeota archaeon]|nr:hypothetical protein [Candidatus Pacearchaeota archaeon]
MKKILIIDDDRSPDFFAGYDCFFKEGEVHHALYVDTVKEEHREQLLLKKEKVVEEFIRLTHLKSSTVYTHDEMLEYLRNEADTFGMIVLDGLESKCFTLIEEVPLDLTKTIVCSGSNHVNKLCQESNIPYVKNKF